MARYNLVVLKNAAKSLQTLASIVGGQEDISPTFCIGGPEEQHMFWHPHYSKFDNLSSNFINSAIKIKR